MKIAIMAPYRVMRPGAGLRYFALKTYLSRLGNDVFFIDYRPEYGDEKRLGILSRLSRRFGLRERNYTAFRKYALCSSQKFYCSCAELIDDPPDADLYITCNDEYLTAEERRDPTYTLDFAPVGRMRATYGTSGLNADVLSDAEAASVKRAFTKFDFISFRTPDDAAVLKGMGLLRGTMTLDQTLLLTSDEWQAVMPPPLTESPYLLVCAGNPDEELKKAALHLRATRGWKICSLEREKYADLYFTDAGPFEFLSLLGHAEYLLTDSYDAAMPALALRRPFCICQSGDRTEERLISSLEELDLSGRITDSLTPSAIDAGGDYSVCEAALKRRSVLTENYFDMMLRRTARTVRLHSEILL